MPETSVLLAPKSVFGIDRTPRSAYPEISVRFPPKYTLNFARRHEVGRDEALIREMAELAAAATAWYGSQWKIRFSEVRAEITLAPHDLGAALW